MPKNSFEVSQTHPVVCDSNKIWKLNMSGCQLIAFLPEELFSYGRLQEPCDQACFLLAKVVIIKIKQKHNNQLIPLLLSSISFPMDSFGVMSIHLFLICHILLYLRSFGGDYSWVRFPVIDPSSCIPLAIASVTRTYKFIPLVIFWGVQEFQNIFLWLILTPHKVFWSFEWNCFFPFRIMLKCNALHA